jgi:hypothetical protein
MLHQAFLKDGTSTVTLDVVSKERKMAWGWSDTSVISGGDILRHHICVR